MLAGNIVSEGSIKGKKAYGVSDVLRLKFFYDNSYKTEAKNTRFLSSHSVRFDDADVFVSGLGTIVIQTSKDGNTYTCSNPYVRLFGKYNSNIPPLKGYIENTTTETKIDISEYLINGDPQQILLSSGHYECKFYNGTIGSGSYYEYTYSFEVIKKE